MSVSPARIAAFEILLKIETEKAFSSALLPVYEEKLAAKDRALCHQITLGTLRKQIYLDRLIEILTGGKKIDVAVRVILRGALYQLTNLERIPAHAAINDAVNLTRRARKTSAKSFVNAVLRRFTRERITARYADEIERLATETSHPRWLVERWIKQFGAADAARLAAANNETPLPTFRLTNKSDAKTVETLKKLGAEIAASETVEDAWTVSNSNEMLRVYAAEGKIYFQDAGSQIVARAVNLQPGESFLDVCAAPGSKTTQVASLKSQVSSLKSEIQNPQSKIQNLLVAGDLHPARVRILQANCRRQAADGIEILRYDAEKDLPFAEKSFDCVLVDAPCSGTGTIRHNPEIRYFLRETDFDELAGKQLRILGAASKVLKKNGRLVYSTCSLETEENEQVADRFLRENADFVKISPHVERRFLTENRCARTFPPRDGTDGFFIAAFEKR